MNIDKLIRINIWGDGSMCFGSLMNIDKLIRMSEGSTTGLGFGSLMNIDKLIPNGVDESEIRVLAL